MTSREIAEITSKLHKNILQDIRIEAEKLDNAGISNGHIFQPVEYEDAKGEMRPQYILSKDGVMMLAMKYDTVIRYKITQKLKELEESNKLKVPQTYAEALLEAGRLALENEKLSLDNKVKNDKIEKDKPLVEFAEQVAGSVDTLDMGDFAKMLYDEKINVGRNKLFDWLKMKKIFTEYSKPMQSYIVNGWFELTEITKVTPYGPKIYPKVLIKGLGQVKITEMLRSGYDEEELKAYKKSKGNIILDL